MKTMTAEELCKVVALGQYALGAKKRGAIMMNMEKPKGGWPKGFPKVEVICDEEEYTLAEVNVQDVLNWVGDTLKSVGL